MKTLLWNMGGRAWALNRRLWYVPALAILLALGGIAATTATISPLSDSPEERASEASARAFVVNSATFRFDGIEESLRLESRRQIKYCPGCYEYNFYFESGHPGVGDRTGVELRSEITPHRAVLNLVDITRVAMGVMDDSWDTGRQLIIDRE